MSDSVRPHRQPPTRLPHPWDSQGKNTGVGCHFLLQCVKVKSESEVAQWCLIHSDPMDCSLPGSSIHGIFQARVLEWVPLPSPLRYGYHANRIKAWWPEWILVTNNQDGGSATCWSIIIPNCSLITNRDTLQVVWTKWVNMCEMLWKEVIIDE